MCRQAKGRRACRRQDNSLICPPCCAAMRGPECQGCAYFADSAKYQLEKNRTKSVENEYVWHKLRQTEGELIPAMMEYAVRSFDASILEQAWDEFWCWPDEMQDMDSSIEFESIFIPWFLFNWVSEQPRRKTKKLSLPEKQIALCYKDAMADRLDAFHARFIESACGRSYSFYSVTEVVPGQALALRDIFLEQSHVVKERNAAVPENRGLVFFTRILTLDGTAIMLGASPLAIPPSYQAWLIDRREEWKKTGRRLSDDFLAEYDIELRDLYGIIKEQISRPPVLHNTDGDLLEMHTLYFELFCSVREAFDRLKPLRLDREDEEFLSDAVVAENGDLKEIEFVWLKSGNSKNAAWDNTVMGRVQTSQGKLSLSVNSADRAKQGREFIQLLLGSCAAYRTETIESADALMKKAQEQRPEQKTAAATMRQEQQEDPEFQAFVREMAEKHWAAWIDEKIPALGDISPRQAVKTKLGREKLEALLLGFEARGSLGQDNLFAPDVAKIRSMLKINSEG